MPYIGTSPSNGVRRVHTYTATASQTTFSGASSEGVTLSYADTNYIDVFQNGVLLGSADYTSTSGTSVVLAQGASADDLIVIVVYDVFSVADTVSKTAGGSFDSGVSVSGDLTVDTDTLKVDSSNNRVGIGTASPHADLHIQNETGTNTGSTELNLWVNDDRGRSKFNLKSTDDGTSVGTFKLTTESTVPSNTDLLIMNNQGIMTIPNQPAFLAIPSSQQNDFATGSNITVNFGTEIYDLNGDFASNTFTAPVTGRYFLGVNGYIRNLDVSANYVQLTIITSNRNYYDLVEPAFSSDMNYYPIMIAVVADMDANDTAIVKYTQSGGSAQSDINTDARFTGYLLG